MKIRKINIFLCISALSIGGLLYILFRPATYIGGMFDKFQYIDTIRQICSLYATDWYKFYLPDFLWAFSLGCGLIAIYNPQQMGIVVCASCSFLCGLIWEFMQYLNVINGTGDFLDVTMYFLASTLCIIINIKETKKK